MQVSQPKVSAPKSRIEPSSLASVRTVSLLGATGSVGTSTVDLLKRGNGRYRVEAVTANRNAVSWPRSRASFGRGLPLLPIRAPMPSSKPRLGLRH